MSQKNTNTLNQSFLSKLLNPIKRYDERGIKQQKRVYFLSYTLLFLVATALTFSIIFLARKSLIFSEDGYVQHTNTLAYIGKTGRDFIKNLLNGHFSFPMWNNSIGFGSDVLTTLHYYGIGDPLNLLSILVPVRFTEYLYGFLIILRLYLAGLSYSWYCFTMFPKKERFPILVGAIIYSFSIFAVVSTRHAFFLNAIVYFPLLLIGVEKIFQNKKPYLFIIMVFLSAISNYYFFYMLVLLVIVYAIIRYFFLFKNRSLKYLFVTVGKFLFYGIIGLLLASVIFLPNVMALLASKRMSMDSGITLFYNLLFYLRLPFSFFTSFGIHGIANWSHIGVSSVVLVSLVLLFTTKKKEYLQLKVGFIIGLVFYSIPFFGSALNGFSYVSNRWVWGYCFLLAIIFTVTYPSMRKLTKKQRSVISIIILIYIFLLVFIKRLRSISTMSMLVVFSLFFISLVLISAFWKKNPHRKLNVRLLTNISILLVVLTNIGLNSFLLFSPTVSTVLKDYKKAGNFLKDINNSASFGVKKLKDNTFFRFEQARNNGQRYVANATLLANTHGADYYFSMMPPNISQYMAELQNIDSTNESRSYGLDGRAALEALASIKYYSVDKNMTQYLPYGFEKKSLAYKSFSLYENKYALPLGYTYKSYIPKEEYEKMSALERQQSMLQGVVLNKPLNDFTLTTPDFNYDTLPFQIQCNDSVTFESGTFTVKNQNATVTLHVKNKKNAETYLKINGLKYNAELPSEKIGKDSLEKLSFTEKINLKLDDIFFIQPSRANMFATLDKTKKNIHVNTPTFTWYRGQHDFLVNLGYNKENPSKITFTFNEPGIYTFDNMELLSQPMENYPKEIEALKEDVLENVKEGTNSFTGTIDLDENKILALSIPYSKGWTAYVDGKETELLEANTMYMALPLEAGHHSIELKYFTPGLKLGIVASLGSLIAFIGVIVYHRRKDKTIKK